MASPIQLTPVAQSVLNPDLRRFVEARNLSRKTRLEQLLYWTAVPDEATVASSVWGAFAETWAPTAGQVPGSLTVCAMELLAVGSDTLSGRFDGDLGGVQGPMAIVCAMCATVMLQQMAVLHGDVVLRDGTRAMSNSMATYVLGDVVSPVLERWTSFAFDASPDVDLQRHLDSAWTSLKSMVADAVQPDLAAWIFDDASLALIYNTMLPFTVLSFVASFVPTWTGTRRSRAGFYDQRYAELIIYAAVTDALRVTVDLVAGKPEQQYRIQSLYETTLLALNARIDALEGPVKVRSMYEKVAALSSTASSKAQRLAVTSGQFERRRDQAQNLQANLRTDQRDLRARRMQFYLWIAAYTLVTATAIALIVLDQTSLFWLFACTVLGLLLVLTIGRMVAGARRDGRA
jgi:hypothetical protein